MAKMYPFQTSILSLVSSTYPISKLRKRENQAINDQEIERNITCYRRCFSCLHFKTYSSSCGCTNCTASLAILNKAARRKLSQNTLPIALTRLGFLLLAFVCDDENSTLSGPSVFMITSSNIAFPGEEGSP